MKNLLLHVFDPTLARRRTQPHGGNHPLPAGRSRTSRSTLGPEPGEQIISGSPGENPKPLLPLASFVPLLAVIAATFFCLPYPAFSNDVATAIALTSAIASLATKRNESSSDYGEGKLTTGSDVKRITTQRGLDRRSARSPGRREMASMAAEAEHRGRHPSGLPSPLSRRDAGFETRAARRQVRRNDLSSADRGGLSL